MDDPHNARNTAAPLLASRLPINSLLSAHRRRAVHHNINILILERGAGALAGGNGMNREPTATIAN